jgi:hypothetical protein
MLAPMGLDPRIHRLRKSIHRLRKKSLVESDGLHRTSGMPEVRITIKGLKSGKPDLRCQARQ